MKLKILYWFPRILAILAILFMLLFSLDSFGGENPLGKQILGFLIHNIPVFILIIVLVFAWKYEITGGALFILMSIALGIFFRSASGNPASLLIITPFLLSGALFILHGYLLARSK
jgi:hypothetical protein